MEDVRIIFPNFKGKEGMYNREGDRNFCVLLDEPVATQLDEDGWNVKALKALEPGDPDQPYLQVSVAFKNRPPKIVIITSKGRTELSEAEVEILDWVDIRQTDLIVTPYEWNVNGRGGIKAYLKSLWVTIEEDPLDIKYANVPEIGSNRRLAIGSREEFVEGEVVE